MSLPPLSYLSLLNVLTSISARSIRCFQYIHWKMSWAWWAYSHSEPLFMRALLANFTVLGICMCSTELLPWKNHKHWSRYPMTLQKRDSIADILPGVDLGRAPPPPSPYFFWNCAQVKHAKTSNINTIYQIELRLKEMTCLKWIGQYI